MSIFMTEKLIRKINILYSNKNIKQLDLKDPHNTDAQALQQAIDFLDTGRVRVCKKQGSQWVMNEWVKKAILLYFKFSPMRTFEAGELSFYDKVPIKKWGAAAGVRAVPPAMVRYGAFVEKGAILMPSYVNIGAYVGTGTLVDTWATVGSCAQIGKNVHLSGGVGIGGVLEPLMAKPVIIEDNVFVGSRSIVVEGVVVKKGAVIGAGVTLTASTHIIDVSKKKEKLYTGVVPENSVVIPGTRSKSFSAGEYGVPCALIIGKRKASTDQKTALNELLR